MFKDILRMCARAPLTADQASRFKVLSGNVDEWRTRKLSTHEMNDPRARRLPGACPEKLQLQTCPAWHQHEFPFIRQEFWH
jgi:hypothetical protein